MQAIVLVGGEGTRLRPLTYGTPKPMVPIANVPFLARTMERLYEAGIRDVILPAGYLPEAIIDYFGDGSRLGMKITYVIEETPLGTAGALKNVEQHITGPFFVLNGDILTSLDLRAMLRIPPAQGRHSARCTSSASTIRRRSAASSTTRTAASPRSSRSRRAKAPTNEINAGTYLLEREVLDMIPAGRNVSIERETFPAITRQRQSALRVHDAATTGSISAGRNTTSPRTATSSTARCRSRSNPGLPGDGSRRAQGHPGDHRRRSMPTPASRFDPSAKVGPNVVLGDGCAIGPECRRPRLGPLGERARRGPGAKSTRQSSRAVPRSELGQAWAAEP